MFVNLFVNVDLSPPFFFSPKNFEKYGIWHYIRSIKC